MHCVPFICFDILNHGQALITEQVNLEKTPIKSVRRSKPIKSNNSHCRPQQPHASLFKRLSSHRLPRTSVSRLPRLPLPHCLPRADGEFSVPARIRILGENRGRNSNLTLMTIESLAAIEEELEPFQVTWRDFQECC